METHPLTARNWLIVALIALVIGLWFVAPYLGVIALAALMAFLFYGTFDRLQRKMRAGGAATVTFLFTLLVVLVPIILVGIFTVFQLGRLVTDITNTFGGDFSSLPAALQTVIANINGMAAQIGIDKQIITSQGVLEFISSTLPGILRGITAFITGFVGSIPFTIILAIMYIFLFYEFLVYGKKITSSIVALSPFQPDVTRMYLARVGLMANAMAKGQLVMSVIIALLEAATLALFFNVWDYFLLMTVAFTLFNLIPLGAGIVIYPIIFIYLLFGTVWPAIGALIVITAVSNLESFLRPKFIPKSITLTNGLTMLAAFGGIALYGLLGVIYGPIIMIIIVTSIQMYLDYYQELPRWKKKANRTAS
jgi:predicted PurR-regulated permease PerM